jgi:hypothetical protein
MDMGVCQSTMQLILTRATLMLTKALAGGKDDKTKYCESQNAVYLEQAKTSIEIRGTYLFYVANSVSQVNVKVS